MIWFALIAVLGQDDWIATSTSGAPSPRDRHTAIWTGRDMIVWGGRDAAGQPLGDGARFDPATNSWTPVASLNAPSARFAHSAVWTGREMIVWGGTGGGVTGGRYDPVGDVWTAIQTSGAPSARFNHGAVWFDGDMMIWGGSPGLIQDGARYTLATDSWAPVGTTGGPPVGLTGHALLWTGTRVVAWGSEAGPGGGIYDPVNDAWVIMSSANEPVFGAYEAVWTGRELLAVGSGPSNIPMAARFDVDTNTWTPITGALNGLQFHQTVWTGREALSWGPLVALGTMGGDLFDPVANTWTRMTPAAQPDSRFSHTMIWTGSAAIVWGGGDGTRVHNSGAMYFPLGSGTPPIDADTGCLANAGISGGAILLAWLPLLALRRRKSAAVLVLLVALLAPATARAQDPPTVEPVPAAPLTIVPDSRYVTVAAGVWLNGLDFDAISPSGPLRLNSGAMAVFDIRGGATLWKGLFSQLDLELAAGDEAEALTLGLDLGWRFELGWTGAPPGLHLELDVYAGPLFSSLSVDESALDDFDPGIGFHAGVAGRGRLNSCWSWEATLEYRSLSYEWTGTGAGDDEAEASGLALLLGFRWGF